MYDLRISNIAYEKNGTIVTLLIQCSREVRCC
jgi:hypothetical protein